MMEEIKGIVFRNHLTQNCRMRNGLGGSVPGRREKDTLG